MGFLPLGGTGRSRTAAVRAPARAWPAHESAEALEGGQKFLQKRWPIASAVLPAVTPTTQAVCHPSLPGQPLASIQLSLPGELMPKSGLHGR